MPVVISERILQLLPAEIGWFVMFQEEGAEAFYDRIICWALVETDEGGGASMTYVDGMINCDDGITGVIDFDIFQKYVFKGKDFVPMCNERVKD